MMGWNLDFITEEQFKCHVRATIMKYGEKLESYDLKRFNSNLCIGQVGRRLSIMKYSDREINPAIMILVTSTRIFFPTLRAVKFHKLGGM